VTGDGTDLTSGVRRVDVVDTREDVGRAVASLVLHAIADADAGGRRAVIGCPAGRTPRSAFAALGALAAEQDADLSSLQIVTMDEFVVGHPGAFRRCSDEAHHSCRRAIELDLRRTVDAHLPPGRGIGRAAVHVPDPADPEAYDRLIDDLGGIDLFLLASGASDGHVAFNPPGTDLASGTRILELAASTRHDNLATFPGFGSIDEVPTHGVTVGLGTIASASRRVVLALVGADKYESFRRVVGTTAFEPDWPATLVHRCRDATIVADRAAADGTGHAH
jgi:glucosamine-6-phosphate deaminase